MSAMRLAIGLSVALCAAPPQLAAQAQQQPLDIETWPNDVPCDKLKKDADGAYELTVPWRRFFTVHTHGRWKNTRETRYWDQKCKGKTQ